MKRSLKPALALAALLLAACATLERGSPIEQQARHRPLPTTEALKAEDCAWIGATMDYERDTYHLYTYGYDGFARVAARARMEQNLTALQSRAQKLGCFSWQGAGP